MLATFRLYFTYLPIKEKFRDQKNTTKQSGIGEIHSEFSKYCQ